MEPPPSPPPPPPPPPTDMPPPEPAGSQVTDTQSAIHASERTMRRRMRPRAMHNIDQPSPAEPNHAVVSYFQKKADQDGSQCVLLLWGSQQPFKNFAWAVDVRVKDAAKEDEIFLDLKNRFEAERRFFHRYLSFRSFKRLRPTAFRFVHRHSGRFSVQMEHLDMQALRDCYSSRLKEARDSCHAIADIETDPSPEWCYPDNSGKYIHANKECPVNQSAGFIDPDCPFEESDFCANQISWIQNIELLSFFFQNPSGAQSQNMLGTCTYGYPGFIRSYKDMRPTMTYNANRPQLRDWKLDGLYVEERINPIRCLFICSGLIGAAVLVGKLIWPGWEIVFGAGSFLVASAMLLLTLFGY